MSSANTETKQSPSPTRKQAGSLGTAAAETKSSINFGEAIELHGETRKGAKEWNEDSYCVFTSPNKKVFAGAIFDGHGGHNGLLASERGRDCFLQFLEDNKNGCEKWDVELWKINLAKLFETIHLSIQQCFLDEEKQQKRYVDNGVVRNSSGDPVHGGTTATMTVVMTAPSTATTTTTATTTAATTASNTSAAASSPPTRWVITANVGDSTGLLISSDCKWQFITVDHGPDSPEEFMRVKALNDTQHPTKLMFIYDKASIFRKYECPLVFLPDGVKNPTFVTHPWKNGLHPTNVRYEPAVYAVTPKDVNRDSTCIAMTRALGDFYAHQFGLTYVPSVIAQPLSNDMDYFVTIGSDGIWDCWKFEDFANFVVSTNAKSDTLAKTVVAAITTTVNRAIANFGAKHYDDSSLIILRIPRLNAPTTAAAAATTTAAATTAATTATTATPQKAPSSSQANSASK